MKADKFRNNDVTELQRQVQEAQEQMFRFRFQMGMGQMEGLKKYRVLRKDRARMLTVLGEKQRNGEMPQAETAGKSKTGKK
jgi:large subunit ribosomal protein L29